MKARFPRHVSVLCIIGLCLCAPAAATAQTLLTGERIDATPAIENLNRIMPGDPNSADGAIRYAGRLWHHLMRPNADVAIDLHTQSRGTAYPMYAFAGSPRARDRRVDRPGYDQA